METNPLVHWQAELLDPRQNGAVAQWVPWSDVLHTCNIL